MKWAEAKTRLSFVTATLNCLWAATPPSFQQHDVDARARQIGGGAWIQRVGLVPELAGEGGGRLPAPDRADPAPVEHRAGPPPYPDGAVRTQLVPHVAVRGPLREHSHN